MKKLAEAILTKREIPNWCLDDNKDIYTNKLARIPYLKRFDYILDSIDLRNRKCLDAGGTVKFISLWPKTSDKHCLLFHEDEVGLIRESRAAKRFELDIKFYLGDLRKKNECFGDEVFDIVTCLDVLEHIADLEGAIRELKRILKPGGILACSYPTENICYKLGRILARMTPPTDHYHTADKITREISKEFQLTKLTKIYPIINLTHIAYFKKGGKDT